MIHFVHGVMMSGKTANAIMLKDCLERLDKNVFMFKVDPNFNGAEGISVSSRAGLKTTCLKIGPNFDFRQFFISNFDENIIMIIDECQFLSEFQLDYLLDVSYPVYMYGIRLDYKGNLFGAVPRIMLEADEVTELPSMCSVSNCKDKATHHLLYINNIVVKTDVVEDLVNQKGYKQVCKHHFKYNIYK